MTICPTCKQPIEADTDGRAAAWRYRIRLYAESSQDELVADTDPEQAPGAPGSSTLHGLPAVALMLEDVATWHHAAPCLGLEQATLQHKLRSLRPTLSKRGGNATWRVHYEALGQKWIARVDVQKEGK